MPKEMAFFIYLLEHYAEYKGISAGQVLSQWDELELTDYIYDMYEMYHIERIENAFDDIDALIREKKPGHVRHDAGQTEIFLQEQVGSRGNAEAYTGAAWGIDNT